MRIKAIALGLAAVLVVGCSDQTTGPSGDRSNPTFNASGHALGSCDPSYVAEDAGIITVLPTGSDDTANLQCAFDNATPGNTVRLVSGEYRTAQLVISDFEGTFTGEGPDETVIYNLPDLVVTVTDFFGAPPGPGNTWPTLMAFLGGDFTVSDLAIKVVGEEPTTGWSIFGLDLTELAHAITVLGTMAHVRVHNVLVEGEVAPSGLFGLNLINGIYPEGGFGGNPDPMTGSFTVERSTLRTLAAPVPFTVVDGYQVRISHNTFEAVSVVEAVDFVNSSVEYSHNAIEADLGVYVYDLGVLPFGVEASTILIRNNRFSGGGGPFFEATFGPGVDCLLLGNNTNQAAEGIYLGPGTIGCTVVGAGNKVRVVDLGTDNIIVGVNNQGEGVGRTVSEILQRLRMLRGH